MAQNFWENDPVVQPAQPQQRRGTPQPIIAFPEPQVDPLEERSKQLTIKQKERELSTPVDDPNAPKLPTGYRWKNGVVGGEAELIPGIPQKGAEPEAPAYSQSAIDAFDRAIASAQRLKTHPGFNAYVGLPSINPLDGQLGPYTVPGSAASDFRAELDAMKAQVFLPMVQSMKGMGALSNAEGQKLTDSIGALDPSMSEAGFAQSLDRIISDLTAYRNRGMPESTKQEAAPRADPNVPFDQMGGTGYNLGGADSGLATPGKQIQSLIDRGMTAEQLNGWAQSAFGKPIGTPDQVQALIAQRKAGQEIPTDEQIITPNDYVDPQLFNQLQQERGDGMGYNLDAAVRGAADVLTAGSADRISAAANTLFGGGTYDENLLRERTITRADEEVNPIARMAGQFAGGVALPGGTVTSIPRAAAMGAGYGAAYGFQSDYGDVGDRLLSAAGGAAAGGAGGAAGAYFGQKLLGRLGNGGGGPPAPPRGAGRVADAAQFGIDLPMEAAGGRGAAIVGNTLSNIPGSAQVMQESRRALTDQVVGAVDNVADGFGAATSLRGMGEAGQEGVKQWRGRLDDVTSKAYDAIPIKPNADATITGTVQALDELTSKITSNPKLAAQLQDRRLVGFLDALRGKVNRVDTGILDASGNAITREVKEGGSLSWNDLKQLRSRIGEEIGEQILGEGTLKSDLRRLYGALSSDMEATARAQGPDALRRFQRANNLYREGQQRLERVWNSLLGPDGERTPEAAAAVIQNIAREGKSSGNLRLLDELRKSTAKSGEWGKISNGFIRLLGQPANSAGRDFQADVFFRNYNDMAPEAKNLLFGKSDLRTNLDQFADVMRNLGEVNALRNTSNTAGQVLTGSALLAMDPTVLVAQAVGSYGAAKMWTDPRFVRWATGYTKMLRGAAKAGKQPTADNIKKQIELLGKTAGANSVIASEVTGLQSVLRAANDNAVAPLAAEPTQSGDPK